MDLHFLGRGGAFNVAEGNTSAYMLEEDKLFLIDCGESVFGRLCMSGVLEKAREIYVVVSHLHADHCGSLSSLALYCFYVLKIKLCLVLPEDGEYARQILALLETMGCARDQIEIRVANDVAGFSEFKSVRYEPTTHAQGMKCFSFVFETQDGAVFYSADTSVTTQLEDFLASHDRIQAIYIEAMDKEIPGGVHLCVAQIAKTIPESLYSRTRLMHLNNAECMAVGHAIGLETVTLG